MSSGNWRQFPKSLRSLNARKTPPVGWPNRSYIVLCPPYLTFPLGSSYPSRDCGRQPPSSHQPGLDSLGLLPAGPWEGRHRRIVLVFYSKALDRWLLRDIANSHAWNQSMDHLTHPEAAALTPMCPFLAQACRAKTFSQPLRKRSLLGGLRAPSTNDGSSGIIRSGNPRRSRQKMR